MEKIEITSRHTPEEWLELWEKRVVIQSSANRSAYSGENCYFGTRDGNKITTHYHHAYANRYMATCFCGSVEEDGDGCKIVGTIGKLKSAVVFLRFMVIVMALGAIAMVMQQQIQPAILLAAMSVLAIVGLVYLPASSVERLKKLLVSISEDNEEM